MNEIEISLDDLEQIVEEQQQEEKCSPEATVQRINEAIMMAEDRNAEMTLIEPGKYTTFKGNSYGTRPHIGGETFRIYDCYHGKKGGLIVTFTPLEAATYEKLELPLTQAQQIMRGFKAFFDRHMATPYLELHKAISERKRKEMIEEISSKPEYSKLGFGVW